MNYRHIYHAGNACDVVKHAVLVALLERMRDKEKGFLFLDTHAGSGRYDLFDERAKHTKESETGVRRVWQDNPAPLGSYLDAVRAENKGAELRHYPGSPKIARRFLRAQDRMEACELHPEDVKELRRLFRNDKQVRVHARDGYEAVRALLPPEEGRALVLIDPPFEKPDEFDSLVRALRESHARMRGAVGAVWYPIKERPAVWRFHESLRAAGLKDALAAEFMFHEEERADRLNGSGFVFVNAPWKFEEKLAALFSALSVALETKSEKSRISAL